MLLQEPQQVISNANAMVGLLSDLVLICEGVSEMEVERTIFQFETEAWSLTFCFHEHLIVGGLDVDKVDVSTYLICDDYVRHLLHIKIGHFDWVPKGKWRFLHFPDDIHILNDQVGQHVRSFTEFFYMSY